MPAGTADKAQATLAAHTSILHLVLRSNHMKYHRHSRQHGCASAAELYLTLLELTYFVVSYIHRSVMVLQGR